MDLWKEKEDFFLKHFGDVYDTKINVIDISRAMPISVAK